VPIKVYDETIKVLKSAVQKAKLGRDEELGALRRLDDQSGWRSSDGPEGDTLPNYQMSTGNVDPIAVEVTLVDDNVTDVGADTELNPANFGNGSVAGQRGSASAAGVPSMFVARRAQFRTSPSDR
jgi:hypothetical protein